MTFKLEYKYSRLDTQKGLFVMDETSDNNELKESLELYSQVFTIVSNTGTKKKLSGKVIVVDVNGDTKKILKEEYYAQPGPRDTWKYVAHNSIEGKKRKKLVYRG